MTGCRGRVCSPRSLLAGPAIDAQPWRNDRAAAVTREETPMQKDAPSRIAPGGGFNGIRLNVKAFTVTCGLIWGIGLFF